MVPPVFAGRNRRGWNGRRGRLRSGCLPIGTRTSGTRCLDDELSGNDWTGEWGTKLTQKSPNLRGSGRIALGVVSVLAVTVTTLLPAEAKRSGEAHHFRAHVVTHDHDYSPPYAAIVVDANSGNVLSAASADELRHPASLTKIMTLYLLFERLEAGKFKLDSQLPVSEHASAQ